MQAGTMNHYEAGQTLFVYGGPQTKHTSQSDADTGIPTMMPLSDAAEDHPFLRRCGVSSLPASRSFICTFLFGSGRLPLREGDISRVARPAAFIPSADRGALEQLIGLACPNPGLVGGRSGTCNSCHITE